MDRKRVVIKKYENRRLYDTGGSRYVNLEDVAEMVRDGADVQVVDAVTGEDLTRVVLTQIIVDDAKAPGSPFPLDMLRQMVISSGKLSQESMLRYMKTMFEMYQSAYRSFSPPMNPFDFMNAMGGSSRPAQPQPGRQTPPEAPGNAGDAEVDELRRRLEELEALVSDGRRPAAKVKKPRTAGKKRG